MLTSRRNISAKDSWWLIELRFIESSSLLTGSLTKTLHFREKAQIILPNLVYCFPPSEPILIKEFLESLLTNWERPAPYNQSCTNISSFASLLTNL